MHKIGIFGVYNSASIGDWAILQGIVEQLQSRSEELCIKVYAMDPDIIAESVEQYRNVTVTASIPTRKRKLRRGNGSDDPKAATRSLRMRKGRIFSLAKQVWLISRIRFWYQKSVEMRGSDLLIIGGGNLLMDLYALLPLHILIFAIIGRSVGAHVMFYSVGAGPISTTKGRFLLKLAIRLAKCVTVRDLESASLLRKSNIIGDAIISPDPALTLRVNQRQRIPQAPRRDTGPLRIGITVVPYYDPRYWPNPNEHLYCQYVQSMASMMNHIIEQLDCQIISFSTNFPADLNTAVDICKHLKDQSKCTIINQRLRVHELIEIIGGCDLVIGTRLHSLILSYITLVPVIGVAYQPKVRAFCERIGFENLVVELGPEIMVDPAVIMAKIDYLQRHKKQVLRSMNETLMELRELSDLSADMAIQLIEQENDNPFSESESSFD